MDPAGFLGENHDLRASVADAPVLPVLVDDAQVGVAEQPLVHDQLGEHLAQAVVGVCGEGVVVGEPSEQGLGVAVPEAAQVAVGGLLGPLAALGHDLPGQGPEQPCEDDAAAPGAVQADQVVPGEGPQVVLAGRDAGIGEGLGGGECLHQAWGGHGDRCGGAPPPVWASSGPPTGG